MKKNERKIKKLEKKFYSKKGYPAIKIPVPPTNEKWGNPLFHIEMVRGRKIKGRYFIEKLFIGIPHLDKVGYTAWREVECQLGAFSLGNSVAPQGSWFFTSFCEVHGMPNVEIYPPKGAKFLVIDSLYSSIMGSVRWEM